MKKRITKIADVCLIVLVVLTFVSRTVYNANLTQVTAVKLSGGLVPLTAKATGSLDYPDASVLKATGAWPVSEVSVKEGDAVSKGETLCKFDRRASDINIQTLQLSVLQCQNSLAALNEQKPQTAADRRALARNLSEMAASLHIAQAQLDLAVSEAPPKDGLAAPCDGVVFGLSVKPGSTAQPDDTMLLILPNDEKPNLIFSLPAQDGAPYGPGAIVQAKLETVKKDEKGSDVFARQAVQGKIVSGILHGDKWKCKASLADFGGLPVAGQDIPLQVTVSGTVQNFAAPLGCLFNDGSGGKCVYIINTRPGLFGMESYLTKAAVTVLYDNGKTASLSGAGLYQGLVLAKNPPHPVSQGDVVWVRN